MGLPYIGPMSWATIAGEHHPWFLAEVVTQSDYYTRATSKLAAKYSIAQKLGVDVTQVTILPIEPPKKGDVEYD